MDTVILKFGGSSVADNIKLNVVAEKIVSIKKEAKNVVVVVSAQGKTTDQLIKEAQGLSAIPNDREMDMLLSTGEQITASKLSILLNRMGYDAISLTGWQIGIGTNSVYGSAKIEKIYTERLKKELNSGKIVIVAGFQGINENGDITTLGRGGSDTTAVALQAALGADKCYIFSDVDGIYSADPNMITMAKKLDEISFGEMQEIADAGAKVLHNRCIQIGEKFDLDIELKSTFDDNKGTKVCRCIETAEVKNIVKNDKLLTIEVYKDGNVETKDAYNLYKTLLDNNIIVEEFKKIKNGFTFRTEEVKRNKIQEILEENYQEYNMKQKKLDKTTIVGYGIIQDNKILNKTIEILEKNNVEIFDINLCQDKIEILSEEINNDVVNDIHEKLILGGLGK